MQEIKIIAWGKEYILNNNSDKYDRAKIQAGVNASPEDILAIYDGLAGLIKDTGGNKIENGAFWKAYKRKKEELPKFIKIIEDRDNSLKEDDKRTTELISKNIDHKRAFLGTLMTISAAITAGLFILFTTKDLNNSCFNSPVIVSGFGFALFIITSSIYLVLILTQESLSLDKQIRFLRESRNDFLKNIGTEITDIDSYEKYRERKHKEEKDLRKEIRGSHEIWFVLINAIFVISSIILLVAICFCW